MGRLLDTDGSRQPPRRAAALVGIVLAMSALGCTVAATAAGADQIGPAGYLPPGAFDILAVLPLPPVTGDARDDADRTVFRETRKLVGTPRWRMAENDVKLAPDDMLHDFACALGVSLTAAQAPRTVALITRASVDTNRSSAAAKQFYRRKRPYLIDNGPICQPAADLNGSYDYPSGHTTIGWTWATMLAEVAPDRATFILARGRAFGESRIVCGVHNASAAEGGRVTAAATIAALQSDPRFVADLTAARSEIGTIRRSRTLARPSRETCDAERALIAQRIY